MKMAFELAIKDLENHPNNALYDTYYKDATCIMPILRDNLTLWTSEIKEEKDKKSDILPFGYQFGFGKE